MKRRIPKDQYLALQKFKSEVNKEREGKLIRDHSGHLYKATKDGSLRRLTRDELREVGFPDGETS